MRRHPLIAYFVLAYLLTWWVYPLMTISPLIGILGLFGPAVAAMIMAGVTGGRAGLAALLRRTVHWRVGLPWYAVALGLPAVLALTTAGLSVLLGASDGISVGRVSILDFVLFVLVVGEELGWRGYGLPNLLERFSPLVASLILGVVWGVWHLPTFVIPGTPQYGQPFVAFVLLTTAYSILLTWLFLHTGGSVLLATLCHGAINLTQGLLLGSVEGPTRYWLLCATYGVAALVIGAVLARAPRRTSSSTSAAAALTGQG